MPVGREGIQDHHTDIIEEDNCLKTIDIRADCSFEGLAHLFLLSLFPPPPFELNFYNMDNDIKEELIDGVNQLNIKGEER